MTGPCPLRAIALLPLLLLVATAPSLAQSPANPGDKPPAYDVVSIKPNVRGSRGVSVSVNDNVYTAVNITLKLLMQDAYGIRQDIIYGAPAWADSTGFDVQAKVVEADRAALAKLSSGARGAMLQPLLADRFQLKVHRETKILPLYELVLAKNGPKFSETPAADKGRRINGVSSGGMSIHNGQLMAHDIPLSRLIDMFAGQLHRGILDKTGLQGTYDISLTWTRDDAPPSPDATAPNLETALQEQLGLKLQSSKGPIETLVVDHAEIPSEN